MSNVVLVVAFLLLPMLIPSVTVTRSVALGTLVAPLATGLAASAAAVGALLIESSILPWFVGLAVVANMLALRVVIRKGVEWRDDPATGIAFLALVALVPIALMLRRPALDWDARLMWMAHGRWYFVGGGYARHQLPILSVWGYSNDYPPLVNATAGVLWSFAGRTNYRTGQLVLGMLNGFALALFGWTIRRVCARVHPVGAVAAGAVAILGAFAALGPYATNGYADSIVGLAGAAGVVLLLLAPEDDRDQLLGVCLLLVATLTKTEGLAAAACVLPIALVRFRTTVRARPRVLLFLPLFGGWWFVAKVLHATTHFDLGRLPSALFGHDNRLDRLSPIAHGIVNQDRWIFGAAALVVVLLLAVGPTRRRLHIAAPGWIAVAAGAICATLFPSYLVELVDVNYYLGISIDRTTILLRLVALATVAVGTVVGVVALHDTRRTARSIDPSTGDRDTGLAEGGRALVR